MPAKTKTCVKCHKKRQLRFYATSRSRVCDTCRRNAAKQYSRKRHLTETYNITQAEYDMLLAAQDGKCGICWGARTYNLQVDHDHQEAKRTSVRESIRGLLCRRCNKLLAQAGDDKDVLWGAVSYLMYARTTTQEVLNAGDE